METSKPRRHSVGFSSRRETFSIHQRGAALESNDIQYQHQHQHQPIASRDSSRNTAPPPPAAHSSGKRRRSAGGRRRAQGGSGGAADFSFSPYQPMVIKMTSSSLSPRPRRASAPVPPASVLHRQLIAPGETDGGGPTLDQCLVLPTGLALKIDELISQPRWKSAEGYREGEGGGGGGDEDDGHGLDEDTSLGTSGGWTGGVQAESREIGLGGSDDRAIISTYTFETSKSQAAGAQEDAAESVPVHTEFGSVGNSPFVLYGSRQHGVEAAAGVETAAPAAAAVDSAGNSGVENGDPMLPEESSSSQASSSAFGASPHPQRTDGPSQAAVTGAGAKGNWEGDVVAEGQDAVTAENIGGEEGLASDRNAFDQIGGVEVDEGGGGLEGEPTGAVIHSDSSRVEEERASSRAAQRGGSTDGPYETGEASGTSHALEARETLQGKSHDMGYAVGPSPAAEAREASEADQLGTAVRSGGNATVGRDEEVGQTDGCASEEHTAKAGATLIEDRAAGVASEESGEDQVGPNGEEETWTASAAEVVSDSGAGAVTLFEEVERTDGRRGERDASEVAATPIMKGASMVCDGVDVVMTEARQGLRMEGGAGSDLGVEGLQGEERAEGQESEGQGGTTGAVADESTAIVSCCSSKEAPQEEEEQEAQEEASAAVLRNGEHCTAENINVFSYSLASEAMSDAAQPPAEHQGGSKAAVSGDSSSVADDPYTCTATPDADVRQEGETELDWEALAREVEAEWVLEGSGEESDISDPVVSPKPLDSVQEPPPPSQPPSIDAAACSLAGSPLQQGRSDESFTAKNTKMSLEPEAGVQQAPPAVAQPKHRQGDGGRFTPPVDVEFLEDSKTAADDVSDLDLPASPPRPQEGGENASSIDSAEDPPARPPAAVSAVEASPAPVGCSSHGPRVAEQVGENIGDSRGGVPAVESESSSSVAPSALPLRDGSHGRGEVPGRPGSGTTRNEVSGGCGCVRSCGCVVM